MTLPAPRLRPSRSHPSADGKVGPPSSGPGRRVAAWLWSRIRPKRRFPPTREGWTFLVATLLVGLAAINGGLNLLFLVWGMMLFLILASGVLSELCLRGLECRRAPPTAVVAGTPFLMGVALVNQKRYFPSFSVEVEDLLAAVGQPIEKRCYFLKLPAGRTQETAYRYVTDKRGLWRLSGYRLSTRFPFGLIHKSKDVAAPLELLVYPAPCPIPSELIEGLASRHGQGRRKWRSRRGEFFGLREFRKGDDPRDIHWRTSARRGARFVRETEDDEGQEICLVFDNSGPLAPAATGDAAGPPFERTVSLAASLARELIARGYRVGLAVRGDAIAPEGGSQQLTRLLRFLAVVDVAAADAPPPRSREGSAVIALPAVREAPLFATPADLGGGGVVTRANANARSGSASAAPSVPRSRAEGPR